MAPASTCSRASARVWGRPAAALVGGREARVAWATYAPLELSAHSTQPSSSSSCTRTDTACRKSEVSSFARSTRTARPSLDPTHLIHFCYPSETTGRPLLPWLAETGIASAVTCVPGLASSRHERLLLPRFIDTGTTSEVEFEVWTSGLRQFIRRPSLPLHAPRDSWRRRSPCKHREIRPSG